MSGSIPEVRDMDILPGDAAYEMFEETLEPFVEESRKYQKLGMYTEAKHFCMGLLKGIYLFEKESSIEYKDWAADVPKNCFGCILDEWKKRQDSLERFAMS